MAVCLIFTGSRGGMLSLGVGFAMMALLIVSRPWGKGHILTIVVFLAAAFLYSLYLGSAIFLERFQDVNDNGRYHTFKAALAIFRQYPWLGSGVATFGDLFYRYEPRELQATYYIYAHNVLAPIAGRDGGGRILPDGRGLDRIFFATWRGSGAAGKTTSPEVSV